MMNNEALKERILTILENVTDPEIPVLSVMTRLMLMGFPIEHVIKLLF